MASFSGGGHSKVSKTYRGFLYDTVETFEGDAEVYVNGKLVNNPKISIKREVKPRWDRIFGVVIILVAGLFVCAKLAGF